jgi:DNA-directed RNA polymerase subunit RPC12/RpoP
MSDDPIAGLNMHAVAKGQKNLCFRCKATLPMDDPHAIVFYWSDREHREVYCQHCGMDIMREEEGGT